MNSYTEQWHLVILGWGTHVYIYLSILMRILDEDDNVDDLYHTSKGVDRNKENRMFNVEGCVI